MREKISFLRGEETEETAAATRRVTRLNIVDPQMDIRSKFKLSPAKGTAADARRNKGAFSRSLRPGTEVNRPAVLRSLLRHAKCFLMSHCPFRCQ